MSSLVRKNVIDDTITIADKNLKTTLINTLILRYYHPFKPWTLKAKSELEKFGISMSSSALMNRCKQIKQGKKHAKALSYFNGKIATRGGKDIMYAELNVLIDEHLDSKYYVGLPNNQIVDVCRNYDSVVACELDKERYENILSMRDNFIDDGYNVEILNTNILEYLKTTSRLFNIYDLDLMICPTRKNLIEEIADGIINSSYNLSVVCVATIASRKITRAEYREIMPNQLIHALDGKFEVNHIKSGIYRDQGYDMGYEIFVLKRK